MAHHPFDFSNGHLHYANPLNTLYKAIYNAMQHAKNRDDTMMQRLIVQIKEEIERIEEIPSRSSRLSNDEKSNSEEREEMESLNQKLRNELQQREQEVTNLKALMQEKSNALAEILKMKENEVQGARAAFAKVSEDYERARAENEKLVASQAELEASIGSSQTLQDQNLQLRRMVTGQEAAIEELQQLVNDLQARKEMQENISSDLKLIVNEKENLIEKLQVAVEESESSLHKSENSVQQISEQLETKVSELEAALMVIEKMKTERQSRQEEFESLVHQLNQSQQEIQRLTSRLDAIDHTSAEDQLALQVTEKYQNALAQIEDDKRLIQRLENEQNKLKSSLKGSDERIAYISSEWKRALENERKLRSQENVEAEEKMAIFEGEIERLKKEGEPDTCCEMCLTFTLLEQSRCIETTQAGRSPLQLTQLTTRCPQATSRS